MIGIIALATCLPAHAQYETTVELISAPATMKTTLEKNAGKLITEFNNAQGEKRQVSLTGIDIEPDAASLLFTLWEVCPFRCDEIEIIERCLNTVSGYQIRNIPVIMEPRAGEKFDEDRYQEIVLNFDRAGKINSLCFALSSSIYKDVMSADREVTDLRKRSMILDFVEQFRTAYNRKDISFLRDIYSDDALIITGKVISRMKGDGNIQLKPEIQYTSQTKNQYLSNLERVFNNNARINVVFEELKVNKHRTQDNIYGVKLVQHWNSGSYSDKGYLFLLWDFKDENRPVIHVRTWQPYDQTPKEQVFELGDFNVEKKK